MVRPVVAGIYILVGLSPVAAAQPPEGGEEARGHVYVAAQATSPWMQGLTEDGYQTYALPPGGFSLGWSVLGGVFVSDHASVEFELSRTGRVSQVEPSRYNITYTLVRRDTFFSGGVRFHPLRSAVVDVEPVVAFDLVREEQWDTRDRRSGIPGLPDSHEGPYRSTLPAKPGYSAGVDLRVGSGRAAFIASFRVRRTFWGDTEDFGNTKEWALVPGAGVRVIF